MIKFIDSEKEQVFLQVDSIQGFVIPSVGCEVTYNLNLPFGEMVRVLRFKATCSQVSIVYDNGKCDVTIGFVAFKDFVYYTRAQFPESYCSAITVTIP